MAFGRATSFLVLCAKRVPGGFASWARGLGQPSPPQGSRRFGAAASKMMAMSMLNEFDAMSPVPVVPLPHTMIAQCSLSGQPYVLGGWEALEGRWGRTK